MCPRVAGGGTGSGGGLSRLVRYFLVLGSTGFGGPIATVGYMQRDLVEQRGWLDRQEFLNGVALGQTMPGPLAAQVTMWVGFLQRGALGALAVSLAIIAIAAYKLAKLTNRRDLRLWAISGCLAIVTAVTGAEIAVLFLAAGLLMIVLDAPPAFLRRRRPPALPALALPALPARPGRTATTVAARTAAALGALAGGGTLVACCTSTSSSGSRYWCPLPPLRSGWVAGCRASLARCRRT